MAYSASLLHSSVMTADDGKRTFNGLISMFRMCWIFTESSGS
jgi:hypothetical protein